MLYNRVVAEHPFDRYAAFTDLRALAEATARPLRKSVRVNTLQCSVVDFRTWAEERRWSLTSVPWCAEGFFIDRSSLFELRPAGRENRETALGRDIRHLLGHFYMQEAASMLPPALLDPGQDEAILDMCAAPGSKTTQIAARTSEGGLRTSGIVVANDVQEKRLWILNDAVQRTGSTNVVIVRKVGQWYAKNMTERFDRVLCDAPCTAQGTARKDSDALRYCSIESIAKMARLQMELLEAAIHACKVGGRIVYSTCTLTPEENESVVLNLLNKFSDQLEVIHPKDALPAELDWDMSKAISDSELVQKSLRPTPYALRPFLRLWPQTYDTEGFFCAVLRKIKPTRAPDRVAPAPRKAHVLNKTKRNMLEQFCMEEYGTPFLLPGELLIEGTRQILLTTEEAYAFPMPVAEYACGIPFAKILNDGRFRITNDLASLRGHLATKGVLELKSSELDVLLAGRDIACDPSLHGDVILRTGNISVGLSLAKEGKLMNRLPRWVVKNTRA